MINMDLEGKNALVGGSTDGIGKATAIILAQMGAEVTLLARNEQKLKQVLAELPSDNNQQHDYLVADFFDTKGLKTTIQNYLNTSQKSIHVLVNNTGGPPQGPLIEKDYQELLKYSEQHLGCFHTLAQAVVPGMKDNEYGRIINITSNAAKQPLPNMGISNTIRAAISNWAKTLANELGGNGITVNNILPGATATKELQAVIERKAQEGNRSIGDVERVLHSKIPLGRLGSPEEIGNVVGFIASPLASYVNGINIVVDGGKTGSI